MDTTWKPLWSFAPDDAKGEPDETTARHVRDLFQSILDDRSCDLGRDLTEDDMKEIKPIFAAISMAVFRLSRSAFLHAAFAAAGEELDRLIAEDVAAGRVIDLGDGRYMKAVAA